MNFTIKNKTNKTIVLLVGKDTRFLLAKGKSGDTIYVNEITAQMKLLKEKKQIQVIKE